MVLEMGQPGTVARVSHVNDSCTIAYFEYRSGLTGNCTSDQPLGLSQGDVILISGDNKSFSKAPNELWNIEPWIGVVKLHGPEKTVVYVDGKTKLVTVPADLELHVGNTVEGFDSMVASILSDDPIRYIDLPSVDDRAIKQFQPDRSKSLEFDDFGGFPEIVKRARELIEAPLEHQKELADIGARPIKGVLFTGPSGTGKTMLARIIAHKAKAHFYQISGPEVLSKWYGQSEELIRRIFEDAAEQDRAIVFFDELDSLASQRGDDSHEASRRIVGQLLASMDGFKPDANVVVIGTTNRPQDIDVALRRPGRFDWQIDFPLPNEQDRLDILKKTSRAKRSDLPHDYIASKTEGWTGAELAAIWSEAALLCVNDGRKDLSIEDYVGGYERVAAHRATVASTSSTNIRKDTENV
jgi:transitional endoplasmic reticulum ATPase